MNIPKGYRRRDLIGREETCGGCAFSKINDPECHHPSYDTKECNSSRERYVYVKIKLVEILKKL